MALLKKAVLIFSLAVLWNSSMSATESILAFHFGPDPGEHHNEEFHFGPDPGRERHEQEEEHHPEL